MLANFAMSEGGKLYGRVCQRWGIDPAAGMDDDVLAYNLRTALILRDVADEAEEAATPVLRPDGGIHYDGGIR